MTECPRAAGAPPLALAVPRRRRLLLAGAAVALGMAPAAGAHTLGLVRPPVALPLSARIERHDRQRMALAALLRGRLSALQLMFTGCSEVCSMQGALFAAVQAMPAVRSGALQLLSLSIDPSDDARAMAAWRQRWGAGPGWSAIVPLDDTLARLGPLLQGQALPADHSAQVYFIDPDARLVWRSEDLPPAALVAAIAARLAGPGPR